MKKILTITLAIMPVLLSAQVVISENFESYIAGKLLAANSDVWTTWSGGIDSEDGYVSDDYASSGANSVNVQGFNGPTDLIWPFPQDYTAAVYELSLKMYVVSGYGGYWNIQQSSVPGKGWMFELYLDNSGGGFISAGGLNVASVSYWPDKWNEMMVRVNLDLDYAEFYLNSSFVYGWKWSLGADGMGALKSLGGVDLFSYSADGSNANYYIDDMSLTKVFGTSSDILFSGSNITVLPNPSDGAFMVQFDHVPSGNYQINVYDCTGRLLSGEQVYVSHSAISNLDLMLSGGIYFLNISNGYQSVRKKLVVKL